MSAFTQELEAVLARIDEPASRAALRSKAKRIAALPADEAQAEARRLFGVLTQDHQASWSERQLAMGESSLVQARLMEVGEAQAAQDAAAAAAAKALAEGGKG